ncbi:peptidoglycan editing factor PgeF [soil metagenome]
MGEGVLKLLTVPNLAVPHGFTTKAGGVSDGHFASLNLGLSTGDAPARVAENRERVLRHFAVTQAQACVLHQIHGARVVVAAPGWFDVEADAAVTDDPELLLVIGVADCAPLLFHDPVQRVVGAAHAGWRGTAQGVARNVVTALGEHYGSRPEDLQVAVGPSIVGPCYQVGPEVKAAFDAQGFPQTVAPPDDAADGLERYRLDIGVANRFVLTEAGVPDGNIFDLNACTHCDATQFYSHRRDGLKRGSHWAAVRLG